MPAVSGVRLDPGSPLRPQVTPEGLCDWDRVCVFIADERAWMVARHSPARPTI
jgi:hypothetical protein